jgi:hypothetical protein
VKVVDVYKGLAALGPHRSTSSRGRAGHRDRQRRSRRRPEAGELHQAGHHLDDGLANVDDRRADDNNGRSDHHDRPNDDCSTGAGHDGPEGDTDNPSIGNRSTGCADDPSTGRPGVRDLRELLLDRGRHRCDIGRGTDDLLPVRVHGN